MKINKHAAILLVGLISAFELFAIDTIALKTINHASVMLTYGSLVIHVDPDERTASVNYSTYPKADLVLITHDHSDHLDSNIINKVKKANTVLIYPQKCANKVPYIDSSIIMANGDSVVVYNIPIKAVPAYNIVRTNHPKGDGNGYIVTIGGKRIYFAGDTENMPEMTGFRPLDIAFIPMNQPFTMTAAMAYDAALKLKPDLLHIYHYGQDLVSEFLNLIKGTPSITVKIDDKIVYFSPDTTQNNDTVNDDDTTDIDDSTDIINSSIGNQLNSDVELYPNPVNDFLYIENSINTNISIAVVDVKGSLIMSVKDFRENYFDVSALSPGLYFLLIKNSDYTRKTKFLKQ